MAGNQEIEIKFAIEKLSALTRRLRAAGFRRITPRTHEINTLYDLAGHPLRKKGALMRLRKYGKSWVLTHKSKGRVGRHKMRVETETKIVDGAKMDSILHALGFAPTFRYEKFRAEWSDGHGHVVVDETPIGNFGEIEGSRRWIDKTARALGLRPAQYITDSYVALFLAWKKRTRHPSKEMTFQAVRRKRSSDR